MALSCMLSSTTFLGLGFRTIQLRHLPLCRGYVRRLFVFCSPLSLRFPFKVVLICCLSSFIFYWRRKHYYLLEVTNVWRLPLQFRRSSSWSQTDCITGLECAVTQMLSHFSRKVFVNFAYLFLSINGWRCRNITWGYTYVRALKRFIT